MYGTRPLRRGTLRVDRHPPFAELLRSFDRTDIGLHGLHHVRRGPLPILEFSGRTTAQCRRMLREGQTIMAAAGLRLTPGFAPPAWAAPLPLLRAMVDVGMRFVTSARDLHTPVAPEATAHGSGLQDVPLFAPHLLRTVPLVHIPTNFQATSPPSRAVAIVAQ
jgi:predicted deacetylase